MNFDLTNFKKISDEKQKAVINAGFLCFGQNGYKKASVADIASVAGISKASLFQYFGNKQNMYLFLYDFAGKEVVGKITEGTDDFFECAEMYVKSLAEVSKDYPNWFDFLVLQSQRKDFSDIDGILEVADELCEFNASTIYDKVDWSKFKDGFDKTTILNIFSWITTGCITQYSSEMEPDKIFAEMLKYLELLKITMYKN